MALYIPKRIKVGYQKRNDTYSKKLAYVIYFDDKGVLRKEKSWEGWRDKEIDPEEYDNVPTSGFVLNKNVERYKWSHYSSDRSYIRIYDPRGIEFEITPENLIGILMHANCSKRGLDGEYVYAWQGTELVLLPVASEEYQEAVAYTERQAQKVSAKTLVPGCSYKTKDGKDVTYLGRFNWYKVANHYARKRWKGRMPTKFHIFFNPAKKLGSGDGWGKVTAENFYIRKSSVEFLASKNSDEIDVNYAQHIEDFQGCQESSKIIKYDLRPITADDLPKVWQTRGGEWQITQKVFWAKSGDVIRPVSILLDVAREHVIALSNYKITYKGVYVSDNSYYYGATTFNIATEETEFIERSSCLRYNSHYGYDNIKHSHPVEELLKKNLNHLYVTLENGKELKIDSIEAL